MTKSAREFKRFYMMALELLLPNSIDAVYQKITDQALALAKGKYSSIFLPDGNRLVRVYTTYSVLNSIIPRKNGIITKTYNNPSSLVTEVAKSRPAVRDLGIKTVVSIPLIYDSKALGVLTVLCENEMVYSEKIIMLFDILGLIASIAIINNNQLQKLEKFIAIQDLFMSVAAHEINSPLASISAASKKIKKNVISEMPVNRDVANLLDMEISRLKNLIDNFLSVEEIKTGNIRYYIYPRSLRETLEESIESCQYINPNYIYTLSDRMVKDKGIIDADHNRLKQVFINLLNNAAKYSPINKNVSVVLERAGDTYKITVIDHGKGILKKDIDKIFGKYYRRSNEIKGGMGLGLYLSKEIIDRHEGDITVQSTVNKGTSFMVSLPATNDQY